MSWHEQYDVVVVGSGAGGLVSAITAANNGLKTLLIEKSAVFGGSSALSGGGLWIPNNHVSKQAGLKDSPEEALTYMETVIQYDGQASTRERKMAYIENGSKMVKYLEDLGMKWVAGSLYPDYYPEQPGGKIGRSIEGAIFNAKELGEYEDLLRTGDIKPPIPLLSGKVASLPKAFTTAKDFNTVVGMFAVGFGHKVKGAHPVSIGGGLVSRLMKIALDQGVTVKLSSPLKDFIIENDRITGIEIEQDAQRKLIGASAVILASGGFDRNDELRKKYHNINADWTSGSPDNKGDLLLLAQKYDFDTELLDDAWWGPTAISPDGTRSFMVYERSMPHSIIVDQNGQRYFNESQSYTDAGQAMLKRQNETNVAIPSWLILESRNRNKYIFGSMLPRMTPKSAIESGFIIKADSIEELAQKTGIQLEGLKETIERFNRFVDNGVDIDFGRGNSAYDNYYGDPTYKNPNLGHLTKPPFYAVKTYPGDLGTKGGFVCDENSRVLKHGEIVEGLYATGNCSASVMGHVYPGPGSTLGPTTVFGYIAANHAVAQIKSSSYSQSTIREA